MPTPNSKKSVKKVTEDPLSSSGVSSLSGISAYNIRKISIFKNGDRFHRGVKFVINPRVIKEMEPLLNQVNDRIELSHGAKKLYTADGKVVSSIKELEDGKIYVAASAQFIPMRYGEFTEKVWKPPSRKHSPIMSSDRIKTARTRSQDPGKHRQAANSGSGVQRSRSVRILGEDRKSRRDGSHPVRGNVNGSAAIAAVPKKFDQPRPKAPPPKPTISKPKAKLAASTAKPKRPPTPKRKIVKKVLRAAGGAGVAVVGASAIGGAAAAAATSKKGKPATPKPKPIPTAVSGVSTASSIMPVPNVESGAAEILEFPEEAKRVDVATIHRTPSPPAVASRSASAKSIKKPATPAAQRSAKALEAKSVSQQPTPESSDEDEGHEEEEEDDDDDEEGVEDDEEEEEAHGSDDVEKSSGEEDDEAEEGEEDDDEHTGSSVGTPASRKSSSAVSSAGSHEDHKAGHEKGQK